MRTGGMRLVQLAAGLAALVGAVGCGGGRGLYVWGTYESSVYAMYAKADSFDPANEVRRLSAQIEETRGKGRNVPPGVQAHLGYLCSLIGDDAGAVAHLNAEKAAFPESARFVDRLLEGLER